MAVYQTADGGRERERDRIARMKGPIAAVCCATLLAVAPTAQEQARPRAGGQAPQMNGIAERYVKLVLAVGRHDADYVDAYYGPPEWKKDSEGVKVPLG